MSIYEQISEEAYREWQQSTQTSLSTLLQVTQLEERPGPQGRKLSYLSHFHAFTNMNDVFGFDGWSSAITSVETLDKNEVKGKWSVIVRVIVRVTLLKSGNYHDGIATESSTNPDLPTSIDNATKSATTQAHKIAFKAFGNYTGLCLYNDSLVKRIKTKQSTSKTVESIEQIIPIQNPTGIPAAQLPPAVQDGLLLQSVTNPVTFPVVGPTLNTTTVVLPSLVPTVAATQEDEDLFKALQQLGY